MSIERYSARAGSMDPIRFQMVQEGEDTDTGIDLTAYTEIELRLKSRAGSEAVKSFKKSTGDIEIDNMSEGIVIWYPKSDSLVYKDGGYAGYFKMTDGAGLIHAVPEGENFELKVLEGF